MTEEPLFHTIGQSPPRIDGPHKLTGRAIYAGDVSLPGMLHLKVLRSDRPHARILAIHTEKAQTHERVVQVFTSRDIPGRNRLGFRDKDQPVLCDEKVRYAGDPVALVAAETLEAATDSGCKKGTLVQREITPAGKTLSSMCHSARFRLNKIAFKAEAETVLAHVSLSARRIDHSLFRMICYRVYLSFISSER